MIKQTSLSLVAFFSTANSVTGPRSGELGADKNYQVGICWYIQTKGRSSLPVPWGVKQIPFFQA